MIDHLNYSLPFLRFIMSIACLDLNQRLECAALNAGQNIQLGMFYIHQKKIAAPCLLLIYQSRPKKWAFGKKK